MTSRSLAILTVLVVASIFSTAAHGQQTSAAHTATLAERLAALRNGWTGNSQTSQQQQQPPNGANQNPPINAKSRPIQTQTGNQNASGLPAVDGSALMPTSRFGRTATQQTARRTPTTAPAASNNAAVRTAARPRAGSIEDISLQEGANSSASQPTSRVGAEGFTLPGLGGSPLPASISKTPIDSATNTSSPVSREMATDYPQGPATPEHSITPATTSGVRGSPVRRPSVRVNPGELRRDLAGAYPTEPTTTDKADETANTSETTNTREDSASSAATTPIEATEAAETIAEPTPSNTTPLAVPTMNAANDTPTATVSDAAEAFNSDNSTAESTTPTPASKPATNSRVDLHSQFDRTAPSRKKFTPLGPPAVRPREAFGETAATRAAVGGDSSVLVSQQTPVIVSDIRGPKQILVGREANYRVTLENRGDTAAEGMIASIRIPSWADVIDTSTSQGTIQQSAGDSSSGVLQWQLVRLDAHANETLDIRLIPRNSRPLELGVNWTLAPVGSRAVVEVQEPKLQMNVSGPDEVLFGKAQLFRLTISNPGTGTAENVTIDLMPPGGGTAVVSSHPLGNLPAGASKSVEVELTAREAGKLSVKAHAAAAGDLNADADKEIFCRKPELEVDYRGPEQKYAGTQATYFFRVRNPGTAPADDVTIRVSIPEGIEFISGSEGQSLDAQRREVAWRIGSLGPGDDYYMELKCLMKSPGASQLKVTAATAAGDLTDNKVAQTNVVALADLKLDVTDPSGPVAVGEPATYEIRVVNRGSSAARDVNIVALFSDGIEPDQAEGSLYTIADGRVSFRTIDELPAGRTVTFKIRAHATQPGTKVFRAEVLCRDLDIKLASEETTRFYADDVPAEAAGTTQKSADRYQSFNSTK